MRLVPGDGLAEAVLERGGGGEGEKRTTRAFSSLGGQIVNYGLSSADHGDDKNFGSLSSDNNIVGCQVVSLGSSGPFLVFEVEPFGRREEAQVLCSTEQRND